MPRRAPESGSSARLVAECHEGRCGELMAALEARGPLSDRDAAALMSIVFELSVAVSVTRTLARSGIDVDPHQVWGRVASSYVAVAGERGWPGVAPRPELVR